MRSIILVAAILPCIISGLDITGKTFSDFEHIVQNVNSNPQSTWKAKRHFPSDAKIEDVLKSRTGLLFDKSNSKKTFRSNNNHEKRFLGLPDSYDARTRYPECTTIPSIKDQSNCGSCWAVSTASVLSDRYCIHSQGDIITNISANYITSCVPEPAAYGCNGGYMEETLDELKKSGVITGGDFESDEGCQPYEIYPCGDSYSYPCVLYMAHTPRCKNTQCSNEFYDKDNDDVYKISDWSNIENNEAKIRREIYKNGPVLAAFDVDISLLYYESGILNCDSEYYIGGHAVRIIGWGVENGTQYWQIANSWGIHWGEKGYFRMRRGKNDCYIEQNTYSIIPEIPDSD